LKVQSLIRERKQIVIIITTVLLAGGFVLFSYMPIQKKIQYVKQLKNEQILTIARGRADGSQMSLVEEQLLSLQTELENYQTSIPAQRELGSFVQQIADLMKQSNLKEQQITPGQEIQKDELSCIPVRIQCKGRLSEVFNFSRQLQSLGRHIRIETAKFENDEQYNGIVNLDTEIVIYYRTNIAQG